MCVSVCVCVCGDYVDLCSSHPGAPRVAVKIYIYIHCPPKVWKRSRKWGFENIGMNPF